MLTKINNTPNFKSAQVNILATSDNHGNVHSMPLLMETIKNNQKDIFIKADEKSTLNIFAIDGDFFINPSKKGYLTKPQLTNGDIQHQFLKRVIRYVNEQAGKNSNFDTVFNIGNHDLDGGDKFLYKIMKNTDMKTLITNVDIKNSPGIQKVMAKTNNVVKSIVYEIPDNKNPDMLHKILFLGITIPSMQFYNPGLLKEMTVYDNCVKKDADLTEENLTNTIKVLKEEIKAFKKENPKGAVVLLSHTGGSISKMILNKVPKIDIVLNGHDHKNLTTIKGKSNINSLGKDNQIIKSLNLKFDDNGDLESTDINTFYSKTTVRDNLPTNPIQIFLEESFSKDMKPLISLKDISGQKTELDYGEIIRYQNSYLANFLTSAVKSSLSKICKNPDIIVGIQSSIIRGRLKDGSNNLDIMKVFDGGSEDLSNVHIGTVSGSELAGLIFENIKDNLKAPKRHTIIQWSDIQVDRTLISDILSGKSNKNAFDAIKIRNGETNYYEPLDVDKKYTIAIGEKYLLKDDIIWPSKIRNRFKPLNKTYDQLFRSYLASDDINYQLKVTQKTLEQRIL